MDPFKVGPDKMKMMVNDYIYLLFPLYYYYAFLSLAKEAVRGGARIRERTYLCVGIDLSHM